jgi:hypothetical protein
VTFARAGIHNSSPWGIRPRVQRQSLGLAAKIGRSQPNGRQGTGGQRCNLQILSRFSPDCKYVKKNRLLDCATGAIKLFWSYKQSAVRNKLTTGGKLILSDDRRTFLSTPIGKKKK